MTDAQNAGKPSTLGALPLWSGIATIFGLASDFARPIGPFALYLLILFALVCAAAFAASRYLPAQRVRALSIAKYALVGSIVFGLVVALQVMTKDAGEPDVDRGFLASVAPPLAGVQDAVLSVEAEPADEFEAAMRRALKEKDETERRTLARTALTSDDAAFRQTAIEKFYLSGDPVLRRQAVIGIFAARRANTLPIVVIEAEGNDPDLAKRLIGKGLYLYSTDTEVGAVSASLLSARTSGTIALTGINLSVGNSGVLQLTAEDDFSLKGTYEETTGAEVQVQILLN